MNEILGQKINNKQNVLPIPINLFLVIFSSVVILAYSLWSSDYTSSIIFSAMLAVGTFAFPSHTYKYFTCAYSLNVISVVALVLYFKITNDSPFTLGGDDAFFHGVSVELGDSISVGLWQSVISYAKYSGFGFILIGSLLYNFVELIGRFDPVNIRILNSFVGATVAPAVYLTGKSLFKHRSFKVSDNAAYLTSFFSILIYYSALGLRDIWIVALSSWFIFSLVYAAKRGGSILNGWILPGVLLIITASFRPLSAMLLVLFWFCMIMSSKNSLRFIALKIFIGIAAAVGVTLVWDYIFLLLANEKAAYMIKSIQEASESSLGLRLLQLPYPINHFARFGYTLFAPVPPISSFSLNSLYIGIGACIWYFIVPLLISGFIMVFKDKDKFSKSVSLSLFIFFSVTLVGISFTSIDVRHKTVIVPMALLYACFAVEGLGRKKVFDYLLKYSLALGLLGVLYFYLKI